LCALRRSSPAGTLIALPQKRVALDGVLPEHFDGSAHGGDLVVARYSDRTFVVAGGDGEHRATQAVQACDNVAADITPYDQDRGEDAKDDKRADRLGADPLNAERRSGRGPDLLLGRLD
jgi:hypothetical protein